MTTVDPKTRQERLLSAIAGKSSAPADILNDPRTREEILLVQVLERIEGIGTPSKEDIADAVDSYLDTHGIGDNLFIASTDISEVLEG